MSEKKFYPVHAHNDGYFSTMSGQKINLRQPHPEMIHIDDIAHALSNICRFGGQTRQFYSVAQHSCLVAMLAPECWKKEALLHDATEAYLGDVIKPLKVMLPGYDKIERLFELSISFRFGLASLGLEQVKTYDRIALDVEYEWLIKNNKEKLLSTLLYQPHPIPFTEAWLPGEAKHYFKAMFTTLFPNY